MKKLVAYILAVVLIITNFSCVFTISAETILVPSEATLALREAFSKELKGEFEKASDGYIGIPVVFTTFVRESAEFNKATILYVVGANVERIGTDTDEDIINDLLDEGYVVTVVDYLDNPLATGTPLSYSLMLIQSGDVNANKYTCGYTIDTMYSYCLPSGCRIVRDIYFYSLDTMALNGTNEYIVWLWNNFYAGENGKYKDAQGNDLPYAETIYDCIKKDGSPMYFDLDMDIIYPANPSEETIVPVMAHASNCETRVRHISRNDSSTVYHIQGLLEGYASVVYDHEYIPMSRNDHYGYYGNYSLPYSSFTLSNTNANAVHSAAIRRIKYLADEYGYDDEFIGVTGFSKSALGPAILADTTHEENGEMRNFAEYCPEGVDPNSYMGEQPWLTYDDGTPISSNVTTVYSGAGGGVCNFGMVNVNDNCVPFASTIGTEDTTGSFKTFIDKVHGYFDSHDIESLYYNPVGLGHYVAWWYNNEFQAENVDIVWGFLDNHIRSAYRDEAPKVLYMTPKNNELYDTPQQVMLKFSRAMDSQSVNSTVKVISVSTGKEISGSWSSLHGNTSFYFNSVNLKFGDTYRVVVPVGVKAQDGVATDTDFIKSFSVSGDITLSVIADTFVSSSEPDKSFGDSQTIAVSKSDEGEELGILAFNRKGGFTDVTRAYLVVNKLDSLTSIIGVFAKNGTIAENSLTFNNINKDDYTSVGIYSGDEESVYIDVSDYLKNNTSENVTFMLTAPFNKGETYYNDFEETNADNFKLNTHYAYGAGSATMSFVDGTLNLTGRSNGNRLKFIDGLGKAALEQSDLGSAYKISVKVKSEEDNDVLIGLYAQSGTVGYTAYGDSTYAVKGGEWTTLEHYVTITQQMIDINTDCVTLVPKGTVSYYIDEIKVEALGSGGTFASKENTDAKTSPASLILWTPEKYSQSGKLSVIGSGKDKNTVLNESYTVNADGNEDFSATKKGYIKVPISQFNTSASTVEFQFKLEKTVKNSVSIYGILDDDTRFAESFDGNISWDTSYANIGNTADKTKVYGGAPIATVNAGDSDTISVDVKDYVIYMKSKGYSAVTFILIAQEGSTVTTTDFEGMTVYNKIVKSPELASYAHSVKTDPVDSDNSAFYFEKSGSTSPSGYHQAMSLTGLIDTDGVFTKEDIGSKITVTFREYNAVSSEHNDCYDFGNIGTAGASTTALKNLPFVTKTIYDDGSVISSSKAPMNKWYDVKYEITVTKEAVDNYSTSTAVVIANGWTASGVYIDDIVVTKEVQDIVISSTEDFAPVESTDFENISTFTNYSLNSYMSGFDAYITNDPVNSDNKVMYFEKSGSTSPNGYHQNIALTGLIKKNGVFTKDDIGNRYTITFRQYNSVSSEHKDCYDFGNIAVSGTATSALKLLPFVTKTLYNDSVVVGDSTVPMNKWYDVKYTLEVTEEAVASYSTATSIILAIGWTGNGIYIDDINIDVVYGQQENTLSFVPVTNFNGYTAFENGAPNSWLSKWGLDSGITSDPTDAANDVYYFDKTGSSTGGANSFLENMALTGLIKTDNVFTESDIGKNYTVKYRQYNVVPQGTADCKDFSTIGVKETTGTITSGHYQIPSFVTSKKCIYNDAVVSGSSIPMNDWYDVVFTFTVTEETVASYSDYTSILIACGNKATRCYVDDIVVSVEGMEIDLGAKPGIVYDSYVKDEMTAAAVVDATAPDKNGKTQDLITLSRTVKTSVDGMRKVYATMDKDKINHIESACLNVTVVNPVENKTIYIYGLNSTAQTESLTWNNALGNDTDSNGVVSTVAYSSEPIAEIVLTDETVYTVDISEYLKAIEKNDSFTVVLTGNKGDGATEIISVTAEILSGVYDESQSAVYVLSESIHKRSDGKTRLSAFSQFSVEKSIEKVEFYIDEALYEGYVSNTGDLSYIDVTLKDGQHTVYAVYSYSDNTTAQSEKVTFTVGNQQLVSGDVDGDGNVTTTDLATLKLYLAGAGAQVTQGADLDGNGEINTTDLANLKLKLAGN